MFAKLWMYAAVAGLLPLSSNTASADWQYTKWGMTKDEVTKSADQPVSTENTELVSKYSSGGVNYKVVFVFKYKDELSAVVLHPSGEGVCDVVKSNMFSYYGKPDLTEDLQAMSLTDSVWHSVNTGNVVRFRYSSAGDTCSIAYTPLHEAGAKGGL